MQPHARLGLEARKLNGLALRHWEGLSIIEHPSRARKGAMFMAAGQHRLRSHLQVPGDPSEGLSQRQPRLLLLMDFSERQRLIPPA